MTTPSPNPSGRGARLVRLSFNPSSDSTVDAIKSAAAALIDQIDQLDVDDVDDLRARALAVTHIETGAMFAVKAATATKP